MWRKKKTETIEKNDLKYYVLSTSNLNLGNNILQANKKHCIDEKMAELLKNSSFYRKWNLKIIKE
jgi:hypothetical protein